MEHTAGLGKQAEVWVDGHLLTACDGLSEPDRPRPPGELDGVQFSYMTLEGLSWAQAIKDNPGQKKQLIPTGRWSYTGHGMVVSVMPVVIDFGLLQMTDPNWSTDNGLIGHYVAICIDRLEIGPAVQPDWPDDCRPGPR